MLHLVFQALNLAGAQERCDVRPAIKNGTEGKPFSANEQTESQRNRLSTVDPACKVYECKVIPDVRSDFAWSHLLVVAQGCDSIGLKLTGVHFRAHFRVHFRCKIHLGAN